MSFREPISLPTTVELINGDTSGIITAGSNDDYTLTPPANFLYVVQNIHLEVAAPGGLTTSRHSWIVMFGSSVDDERNAIIFLEIRSDTGDFDYRSWANIDTVALATQRPSTDQGQILALKGLTVSSANPLTIRYHNGITSNSQTVARKRRILVQKVPV